MKAYTVYNSSGEIVRFGTCIPEDFEAQAGEGETVVEGIEEVTFPAPVNNCTYNRMLAYPPVGNQLDAIFKMVSALKDQGIQLPADTLAWLDSVQTVKNTYPKGGA